ncbi:hypothetical protein [Salinibacter ruber]|uniref:hypothetical protein n=1 Tax=Salinibacter ruber TaxID=146919 RepID=UPI002169032B|nr:hypothetical protein [Salinibacter ruber]MCS3615878.1 hypothetical protein [Salinibacter ruber]
MDLPTLVENALSEDAKGGAARMDLASRNTEVQVQTLLAAEVHLTSYLEESTQIYPHVPDQDSVREINLPLDWKPKVEYQVCPSRSGGSVQIKSPSETFGTAKLTLPSNQIGKVDTEELSVAVDPYLAISDAWDDVIGALDETSKENPLVSLSKIRHIRRSAERQKERYATRSEKLLSLAREALLGWIAIALHGVEEGRQPSLEDYDHWLRPSQNYEKFDSNAERQRQALRQKYSRYGLFATEVSKLWKMIYTRRPPADLQLDAIGRGLAAPEAVTSATTNVLELICSDLEEVDEDVIHSQALIGACEAIECVIVETGDIPSEFEDYQSAPTSSQRNDARLLLTATQGMDVDSFTSYKDMADTVESNWDSVGLTPKEQRSKSGPSIVKGSKRFADISRVCDYEESEEYGPRDLISELREADQQGQVPR